MGKQRCDYPKGLQVCAMIGSARPLRPLTRLAPSPTGPLHEGHILHLIWLLGLAQRLDADVLLRLEDHDRSRCRPAFEREIVELLVRLGVTWSWGFNPVHAGLAVADRFRQSDQPERYEAALNTLRANGLLYACSCSRAQIRQRSALRGVPIAVGDTLQYDGHCRDLALPMNASSPLRARLAVGQAVRFTDAILGEQVQILADGADPLVRDRQAQFTYLLCVVADDLAQGVDWVIRGEDLLSSTGLQLALREAMSPTAGAVHLAHHPLLTDAVGRKLSKRDDDLAVAAQLNHGVTPDLLWGQVARRAGLFPADSSLNRIDLKMSDLGRLVAAALPANAPIRKLLAQKE